MTQSSWPWLGSGAPKWNSGSNWLSSEILEYDVLPGVDRADFLGERISLRLLGMVWISDLLQSFFPDYKMLLECEASTMCWRVSALWATERPVAVFLSISGDSWLRHFQRNRRVHVTLAAGQTRQVSPPINTFAVLNGQCIINAVASFNLGTRCSNTRLWEAWKIAIKSNLKVLFHCLLVVALSVEY